MAIVVHAITQKTPAWVTQAFQDYAGRCPRPWNIEYQATGLVKRVAGREQQAREKEAQQVINQLKPHDFLIGLDPLGTMQTSLEFSQSLSHLLDQSFRPILLIGAPEGLTDSLKNKTQKLWSLGPLTLPHTLAKVVCAEQIFRAWSIHAGHPYHRGD